MQMSKESAHPTRPTPTPTVDELKVSFEPGSEIHDAAADFMSMLEDVKQPTQPQTVDANDDAADIMKILEENNRIAKELNMDLRSSTKGLDITPKIKYYNRLAVTAAEKPLTITFDDLDKL